MCVHGQKGLSNVHALIISAERQVFALLEVPYMTHTETKNYTSDDDVE